MSLISGTMLRRAQTVAIGAPPQIQEEKYYRRSGRDWRLPTV